MKIAAYVDCENIHYDYAPQLFEALESRGKVVLCNGYADFSNPFHIGWKDRLFENKMRAIQVFPSTKDGSDAEILVDVTMDAIKIPDIDCFCVVSNDGIYSALARPLKLFSKTFLVLGTHRTHTALINACDIFQKLDKRGGDTPEGFIDAAIERAGGGKILFSRLGIELGFLGFNLRDWGHEKLIDLIASLKRYTITSTEQIGVVYVERNTVS
jgi:uncharacterized LabA/DUF88 family protein